MGYKAQEIKFSFEIAQVVPEDDPDFQEYLRFRDLFGEDGNVFVIGVQSRQLHDLDFFNSWVGLAEEINELSGVERVVSVSSIQDLKKNTSKKRFELQPLFNGKPQSQAELDSLFKRLKGLPFYEDAIVNFETNTTFIAVSINKNVLVSKERLTLLNTIEAKAQEQMSPYNVELRYSGLPYIRTSVANLVKKEMQWFSLMSLIVCAGILLIFFRSLSAVVFPVGVICIIVVWALGTIVLFDFRINAVTSLIPPLIIIIGVPNFIYFVNKYHNEFKKHGNKMKAIHRMVQKIGVVTLMTNITTAVGFLVLYFTDSPVLREFGLVAGINIIATFVVSVIVFPVFFSYLPEPNPKHTRYLDRRFMNNVLKLINTVVARYRPAVFLVSLAVVGTSLFGLTKLQTLGFILDDIPQKKKVYKDLKFFERNFGGVLPFEVMVSRTEGEGIEDPILLQNISEFQDSLKKYDELSRSVAVTDLLKFSRQAYYNGIESRYDLPRRRERTFMLPYIQNVPEVGELSSRMVDSSGQVARISVNIADVGSIRTQKLMDELKVQADSIFREDTKVSFTGISLLFLKNNGYLIKSLINSMILAFIVISILMGLLFRRVRMILVSLLPNFIPLLATAGIMGFMGIALKPSTVLVFSIAFGISIDDALHFLAKYRQELKQHSWDVGKTIAMAINETGRSMIYTSVVLFAGFSIFAFSNFGGTTALGFLTSTTLLIAMVTNLVLLPSLILSFFPNRKSD